MKSSPSVRLAIVVLLIFWLGGLLHAQDASQLPRFDGAARYYLGDRDQILININVWGYVQKPGQYLVPRKTDLISLISFAGGPREGANLSEVTIVRAGRIETDTGTGQNGKDGKVPILTVDIKHSLQSGEVSKIPLLQAGDTVMLSESGGSKFQKFLGFNSILSVIAATASIALIIDRVNQ